MNTFFMSSAKYHLAPVIHFWLWVVRTKLSTYFGPLTLLNSPYLARLYKALLIGLLQLFLMRLLPVSRYMEYNLLAHLAAEQA